MLLAKLGFTRKPVGTCFLLAILAGVAFLLTQPAPAAAATGKCGSEIDYYSDSTFHHLVGIRGWTLITCGCHAYTNGTLSGFTKIVSSFC